jgi:hypothetical protein
MKPTFDSVRSTRFPITDCNYQSVVLDSYRGGCAQTILPSFRSISSDYFKNEARHDFVGEATFFAMIIITAALPILQNLHALAHFIRAIGGI